MGRKNAPQTAVGGSVGGHWAGDPAPPLFPRGLRPRPGRDRPPAKVPGGAAGAATPTPTGNPAAVAVGGRRAAASPPVGAAPPTPAAGRARPAPRAAAAAAGAPRPTAAGAAGRTPPPSFPPNDRPAG